MLYFYGDERKVNGILSVLFYSVLKENLVIITDSMRSFRLENNLKSNFEFHYYDNTRDINMRFADFIKTLPIEFQISVETTFNSEPASHIIAFDRVTTLLATTDVKNEVKFFFDKLGGPKTEGLLRTEFGRFCRHKSIRLKKPIQFIDSRKSDFIQIADYLVAMNNQSKI